MRLEHRQRVTLRFTCFNLMPVGAAMASTLSFGNAVYLYLPVGYAAAAAAAACAHTSPGGQAIMSRMWEPSRYVQMLKAFTPVVTLALLCLSGIEARSP